MDDEALDPTEPEEPIDLGPHEKADIAVDLEDLGSMRSIFSPQGVKGVVIECEDCGANHFYEWELLRAKETAAEAGMEYAESFRAFSFTDDDESPLDED